MQALQVLKKSTARSVGQARALLYTLESLPLPVLHRLIAGVDRRLPSEEDQRHIINKARQLLAVDADDFVELNLPLQLLAPENPGQHFPRWMQIMGDSTLAFWRRRNSETQAFSSKVKNLDEFPDYYQRNFHHQTDGYLTEKSAAFYEHQVELLFRGLADPMRRRLLKPLVESLQNKKRPKILEIACGTGSFTQSILGALPNAHVTAIDLSPAYIQYAKKRFIKNPNVDFVVMDAEKLPFKANSFDAVVSVFLHHELPQNVRQNVINESLRVAGSKGFWGMVDSIQLGDDPQLDWAIKEFPKNFHEPFFTNYIKNPVFDYLQTHHGKRNFKEKIYLLSKVIHSD